MKITPPLAFFAAIVLCSLAVAGCSTTTTARLTGPPNTLVTGHYRATHSSSDFAGPAPWQLDFGTQRLEEFEFRKADPERSVDLEIRQGQTSLVHTTAAPGTLGLRARRDNGWTVEVLR